MTRVEARRLFEDFGVPDVTIGTVKCHTNQCMEFLYIALSLKQRLTTINHQIHISFWYGNGFIGLGLHIDFIECRSDICKQIRWKKRKKDL